MAATISGQELVQRLRAIQAFADLPEDGLDWLASRMTVTSFEPGELIRREGDPADSMFVILKGGIRGQIEMRQDTGRTFEAGAGDITGLLPYSRLTHYPLTIRAVGHMNGAELHSRHFPELIQRLPQLAGRLVNLLSDRIREYTRTEQQQEKLAALGKLSAGLAHELNNPAGAAARSAQSLRDSVYALRKAEVTLVKHDLSPEQRTYLVTLECNWDTQHPAEALDALDRSDREDEIARTLEARGVPQSWEVAAGLVDAGATAADLEAVAAHFPGDLLAPVLTRLTAAFAISRLAAEIESSTSRISELVRSIKEYSYMDQAPAQEVDVHQGIESTLVMLRHKLKSGITIVRDYDNTLPRICAYGGELNQVWTNLVDNAIDAMNGKGELAIRTGSEFGMAFVEVRDNGSGIPANIKDRIFEPFFTTKGVGQGTGLGLDTVYRIIRKHHGEIKVDSKPGDTRFLVRLPFAKDVKDVKEAEDEQLERL